METWFLKYKWNQKKNVDIYQFQKIFSLGLMIKQDKKGGLFFFNQQNKFKVFNAVEYRMHLVNTECILCPWV